MTRPGRRLLAHLALALAGAAAVLWALTWGAHPAIMCRDVVMAPGTVCANADGTATQTYEQRLGTWRAGLPVVIGVGTLVAGFGVALAVQDARAGGVRTPSDAGPRAGTPERDGVRP